MFFISTVCILCLNTYKDLKTILIKDTDGILVQDKLRNCLPEIVDSHLETSKYICSECMRKLDYFYKFKQTCLRNDINLKNYLQTLTSIGETQKYLSVKLTDIKCQIKLEAKSEDQTFSIIKSDVLRTEENEDTGSEEAEAVYNNEIKFADVLDIEETHLLLDEGTDITVKEECVTSEEEEEDIEPRTEFVNCNTNVSDAFVCVNEDIQDAPTYSNNSETKSTEPHVKNKTNKPYKFYCGLCDNKYVHKVSLKYHLKAHAGIKEFSCSICDKKFRTKFSLNAHENNHNNIKKYECKICNKRYSLKAPLLKHEIIHTGLKNFECATCKKRFLRKGDLKLHEKIHTDIKDFQCSVCGKKFLRKTHWIIHENMHAGVKNYQCELCEKMFLRKGDMMRHEKIHARINVK